MRWIWFCLCLLSGCVAFSSTGYQYTQLPSDAAVAMVEYSVYVDQNFGEADLLNIDNALRQWNMVFNGYAHFTLVSHAVDMGKSLPYQLYNEHVFLVIKVGAHYPSIPPPNTKGHITIAWCNRTGGHWIYLIRDNLDNDMIQPVLMHEIGHALGASHVVGTLMDPTYSSDNYRCVDYRTARQVAEYQHWDIRHLNYCVLSKRHSPLVIHYHLSSQER